MTTEWTPTIDDQPFDRLGGEATVRSISDRFYDIMDAEEPELARLHPLDEQGRVHPENRERFALFLVGWLGGPQEYIERHGHPRLRMRHGGVGVNIAMRDAWVRCMTKAMDDVGVQEPVRSFLNARFAHMADFLRNMEG